MVGVLVAGFPAGSFQTNCYVVAPAAGESCIVVDPGQDAVEPLEELLREHRLTPVAVLLTHGHFDHTLSVAPVCDGHDVPAWIHPGDREMLADPMKGLSPQAQTQLFGGRIAYREPSEVRVLEDGAQLDLAGLTLTVDHTPGHTPGSAVFRSPVNEVEVLIAGDTLFAGSIGRTDLPGGDIGQMMTSLRDKLLTLDDSTVVLPGHGPSTTIGRERVSNPFLQDLGTPAPGRGL